MLRRTLLTSLLATPALAQTALAQPAWPTRPVRFIVPFAAGGPVDVPARFLAEYLAPRLGQPVIVENRSGAGGAVGVQAVMAATDGHSLLFGTGSIAIQPALQPDIGYDPLRDLTPISLVSESPMAFSAPANGRITSLPQLIAFARANPGKVTYGSSGTGTTTHMVGALFALRAGVEMVHVPYRGAGQMIGGFLAGDLDLMIGEASTVLPHVREGRAIAVAQTAAERSPVLPNAPTLEETIPGTAMPIWFALCGSRATPPEAAARLVREMAPLRDGSDLAQRMAANGAKLLLTEPQVLRQRLEREVPLWRQVVQQAGIKAE